jgi:hypothetical protein
MVTAGPVDRAQPRGAPLPLSTNREATSRLASFSHRLRSSPWPWQGGPNAIGWEKMSPFRDLTDHKQRGAAIHPCNHG